jgi:ATP-dependent Clp protease ATP-binding subunit ClpC
LASFLFLGPTGVGKTELAKTLARELFGSEKLLLQINMSELMEMHSVSKLIGSPPGYVGFESGGQLTNFVKRKPYSVVLFDEIEKAHPDTLNILLQILEEGEVTDGKGQRISMRNSIVVMTSNIGASDIISDSKLGFDIYIDENEKSEFDHAYEDMRDRIMADLRNTLRPELINRIDLVDIFRGLNREDCQKITDKLVNEFILRLISQGVVLDISNAVNKKISEDGYSKEYGVRNIKRKIQELLENGFAKFMLESNIVRKKNQVITFNVNLDKNGDIVFKRN